MSKVIRGNTIHGRVIDNETRCAHWHSPLDIIAIKFKCCDRWYPCFDCHAETAGHEAEVWPAERFDEHAIMCGACGRQLTIKEYTNGNSACPTCDGRFNPGCSNHFHLYFEV